MAGTELDAVRHLLDPSFTRILVVEMGDRLVACWSLLNVWHLEGLWVDPAYRHRPSVARRLWVGMRRLMASVGASGAVTAAITEDVEAMLARKAIALPGRFYVLRMGD